MGLGLARDCNPIPEIAKRRNEPLAYPKSLLPAVLVRHGIDEDDNSALVVRARVATRMWLDIIIGVRIQMDA